MRKQIERITYIILFFLAIITLVSCGKDKWDYSKEDVAKFAELTAEVSKQDDVMKLTLTNDEPIFKSKIKKSDILLFEYASLRSTSTGYLSYKEIKNNTIKISNASVESSKKLELTFSSPSINNYGVIIHKSALTNKYHAIGAANYIDSSNSKTITEYEEQLIAKKGTWSDMNSSIQMANYVSQIILSVMTDNPISFAGGVFGVVSTLGSAYFSSGASLDSIAKQLDVVDAKLDAITNQIDENQKQILDEFVRTQAMIDEVKVIQYNQNITAYQTDYVKPINDYLLVYKDSIEQALRKYVSEERNVRVYYGEKEYNANDVIFASEEDISSATYVDFQISEFSYAKAYLKKNKDIVGDGFAKELNKDILAALDGVTLPTGREKSVVAEDIYKTLIDNINQDVLTKEDETLHRDVLQFVSNFVSYANALAGINFESVINSYISRLEYIYNFHGEIKEIVRGLLASIKLDLDYYVSVAQTACIAQKINYTSEIYAAYSAAADYISSVYESHKNINDNYSYCVKDNVQSGLYNSIAEVSFTNLGNSPTFHANFKLKTNIVYDGGTFRFDEVDVNEISFVDYSKVRALVTRYNLIKSLGQTTSKTFIDYLLSLQIISRKDYATLNSLFETGRTTDNTGKILTSYSIRDLNNSDNVIFTCECYGNPGGYYFSLNRTYKYRYTDDKVSADYWSGKIAYGDIIDGKTGTLNSSNKISAYAKYSESHFFWIDDEHWGFSDEHFGDFYFILMT